MKSYIKRKPLTSLPDKSSAKRELSDNIWKDYIFDIILKYYSEVDNNEVISIISKENTKPRAEIETKIKEHIYFWYKKEKQQNFKIDIQGFILNLEPSSLCKMTVSMI